MIRIAILGVVISMSALGAQLDKDTSDKVKKIYERVRRNAVVLEEAPVPDESVCVSAQNFGYSRLSYAHRYTTTKRHEKSEHKSPNSLT